jgi:hypothetical protein
MKESVIQVYRLSEAGRSMTWGEWQSYGYGLPDWAEYEVSKTFGPIAHRSQTLTLGNIEDASPFAGRIIARVFVKKLCLSGLAILDGPPRVYS